VDNGTLSAAHAIDPIDVVGRDATQRVRWRLTDLIDVEALQSIQDTFARAFGLPTAILNPDGTYATEITNRHAFCEDLTRGSAIGGARCGDCDRCMNGLATDRAEPNIIQCWNGLYDCAVPIRARGSLLGYFLCGQVLDELPDVNRYRRTAEEIGANPEAYLAALASVPVLPRSQYEASVESMHVLAKLIGEQALSAIETMAMVEEAREARDDAHRLVGELDSILAVLGDIRSYSDDAETLEAVVDRLAGLVPAESCVVYLVDEGASELTPVVVRSPVADKVLGYRPPLDGTLIGRVATSRTTLVSADVTREPGYRQIPGVPAERESGLFVPLIHRQRVLGVIWLSRFDRRTFTDHEVRLLEAFSSQASVAIEVSRLSSENRRQLQQEQLLGALTPAMAPRAGLRDVLGAVADAGAELLGAEHAVVFADTGGGKVVVAQTGLSEHGARAQLAELGPQLEQADAPDERLVGDRSYLLVPLASAGGVAGCVFSRRIGRPWDEVLAGAISERAAVGVARARLQSRERELLLSYQRLSQLGSRVAAARDADDARRTLVTHTAAVVGADGCVLVLLDRGPDALEVDVGDGQRIERHRVSLERAARVAALRLRDDKTPNRAVFDAFVDAVFAATGDLAGGTSFVAQPLMAGSRILGAILVTWKGEAPDPSDERLRLLDVVASAGAGTLARFEAATATDEALRDRLVELEALGQLAEQIAGMTDEPSIARELARAYRQAGDFDAALYVVAGDDAIDVRADAGSGDAIEPAWRQALSQAINDPGRAPALPDARKLYATRVLAPGGEEAALIGVASHEPTPPRQRVMATLARYGSMAFENADLHDRREQAITNLRAAHAVIEREKATLERILTIHDALAAGASDGHGLRSIVTAMNRLIQADVAVLDPSGAPLARSPERTETFWQPELSSDPPARLVVAHDDDGHTILAAQAAVGHDTLAWVTARLGGPVGEAEQAAVEYGALLVGLELLRERTALDVEMRLRGGFLEDLLSPHHSADLLVRQALAFEFDLRRPSRVVLVERAIDAPTTRPDDLQRVFRLVERVAAKSSGDRFVALKGTTVVALVQEADEPVPPFEDELVAALADDRGDRSVKIGAGTLTSSVGDYHRSYVAAKRGLELLQLSGREERVFSFRTDSLETLLLSADEPVAVLAFVQRFVTPLDDHDRSHSSDLRHTVERYFAAGGKLEPTARCLHIHVSTLRYRLDKASALLGVDVRDPTVALDVQVALRAAQVLAVRND
jgi:sugar diacid utilization regulator/ligand-binding sensor protein/GAF domain-containing protein